MLYREPVPRSRPELEADLSALDADVVCRALDDAAHFADPAWLADCAAGVVEDDDRPEVRRAALTAIATLARRGYEVDRHVLAVVVMASTDPELAGAAVDALDDLRNFGARRRG